MFLFPSPTIVLFFINLFFFWLTFWVNKVFWFLRTYKMFGRKCTLCYTCYIRLFYKLEKVLNYSLGLNKFVKKKK